MGRPELRTGKHARIDNEYLENRRQISATMGLQETFSIVDHWPLFVGIGTLARNLVLMAQVRETLRVPGDIVEFGSWKGATLMLFAKLLALWDPHGSKVVHGFSKWDVGFSPDEWRPEDNGAVAQQYDGACNGDWATLVALRDLYNLRGAVELWNGDILQTWPTWQQAHPHVPIALALVDVDLYAPTHAALQGLHERLLPGARVVFDEFGTADWPGETQAALEFMAAHPGQYEAQQVLGARQPTLALVRR